MEEGIAVFFLACLGGYAAFIIRAAWFFAQINCPPASEYRPVVSVIIPARNEAENIGNCLQAVLQQSYPIEKLEVIVVNDHSTDETSQVARGFIARYPFLKVLDLQMGEINSYKKAAISAGVTAATGDIILQTDADCKMGVHWVACMVDHFSEQVALVSGPIEIVHTKTGFTRFQTLESMGLVAIGAGSLAAGRPNMCNGANLAYRKAAFEAVGGFAGIDAVASGDDELLLQKLHAEPEYQLRFAKCREAIVQTDAMNTWQAFKNQRLRWVSKARFYPNRWVNVAQAVSYLAFLGILVLLGMGIYNPGFMPIALLAIAVKVLVDASILYQAARFFHNLRLLGYLILLQPIYLIYVLWIGIAGNLIDTYSWKGRTVK